MARKLTTVFAYLALAIAALGLLYRSTLYWLISVHPGDPYGFGDVLDALFALLVMALVFATLIAASPLLFTAESRDWKFIGSRVGIVVASCAGYMLLHSQMPRLM